jgi:hypothetical protein
MLEEPMENEKNVLRWGGIAGILAIIVWIVELPLYGAVDPFAPAGLSRFSSVRAALGISTILMMAIALLSMAFILALYRALRMSNLAFALYGGVLGVIGYITTALGDACTFFAFSPLSDLYQSPTATMETQASLALLWQAAQGITHTFFFVGSLCTAVCFITLGVAMLRAPDFGMRYGVLSIVLGLLGVAGVAAGLFLPGEVGAQVMGIAVIANLILLPLLGWKLYRISRQPGIPEK